MKYQIIIKNLENDEEILNEKCEAIIGGIGIGDVKEKGYETCQMSVVCGNVKAVLATLEVAEKTISSVREQLINDMIKNNPDSPLAHLKAFFDSIKKQDEGDSNNAVVD